MRKAQLKEKPEADTVFGKIIRKEIPAKFLYEDDQVLHCTKYEIIASLSCTTCHVTGSVSPVHFSNP